MLFPDPLLPYMKKSLGVSRAFTHVYSFTNISLKVPGDMSSGEYTVNGFSIVILS
jgi:hypothetical protein